MGDALAVGSGKPAQELAAQPEDVGCTQSPGREAGIERLSVHEIHDVVDQPTGITSQMNRNDVRMVQSGEVLGFL